MPLLEIGDRIEDLRFSSLWSNGETFDARDASRTLVTVKEKLKAVYDALFVTVYTGTIYDTKIGSMTFDTQTKEALIRAAGLLSDFTRLDADSKE